MYRISTIDERFEVICLEMHPGIVSSRSKSRKKGSRDCSRAGSKPDVEKKSKSSENLCPSCSARAVPPYSTKSDGTASNSGHNRSCDSGRMSKRGSNTVDIKSLWDGSAGTVPLAAIACRSRITFCGCWLGLSPQDHRDANPSSRLRAARTAFQSGPAKLMGLKWTVPLSA